MLHDDGRTDHHRSADHDRRTCHDDRRTDHDGPTGDHHHDQRAVGPRASSTAPRPRRLCVGVVTPGDRDAARHTIRALRLYHPEVVEHTTFVILDSEPAGAAAARDRCMREADADVVCCIDGYTLLEPGTLAALLADPFAAFDGIFCLNLDGETQRRSDAARRHARLGIGARVERFPGIATPDNPHRGIAMGYRRMLVEARRRGWEHVLVLEDDAVFLDDTLNVMQSVAAELHDHEWDLCYLGACVWSQEFPPLDGSAVLQACGAVTCTHAVAFHMRAYDRLLADIPEAPEEVDRWLEEVFAIDQYLSHRIADGTYRAIITSPRVASQPNLLDHPDADGALGSRYVT